MPLPKTEKPAESLKFFQSNFPEGPNLISVVNKKGKYKQEKKEVIGYIYINI